MRSFRILIGVSVIIQITLFLIPTSVFASGDTCATATRISLNTTSSYLQINPPGDVDYFYFTLPAPGKVTITGGITGHIIEGYLMNSTCTHTIASGHLWSHENITVSLLSAGTYKLKIKGLYFSTTGNYWIKVAFQSKAPEIAVLGNELTVPDEDTSPNSVDGTDFGEAIVGGSSIIHAFNIINKGTAILNLTGTPSVTVSGANADDFSIIEQPGSSVAINGTTSFRVAFNPSSEGLREATITIPNNDSNENPYNFAIAGTGQLPASEITIQGGGQEIINGDTIPQRDDKTDFGMAVIGGSVTHTFQISNSGTKELTLTGSPYISIKGPHAGDFKIDEQPISPLGVDETTSFALSFKPTAEGLREAVVTIANDDNNKNPYEFAIRGEGVFTAVPEITVRGNGIEIPDGDAAPGREDGTDFGSAGIAGGSITQTFTINNDGIETLNLTGVPHVIISGAQANDFDITVQPDDSVAPGGSTTFQVYFTPKAVGIHEAVLNIFNDDSNENPYNLCIRGDGIKINSVISDRFALKGGSGDLWTWGTYNDQLESTPIFIGSNYNFVSARPSHRLALKKGDRLYAWGDNSHGNLGDGTTTDRTMPAFIGTDYSVIAAGPSHSLALKSDGSLWAWGNNSHGQLGDGTNTDQLEPIFIGSGYKAISAGSLHSLALKNDGSLWAWGYNSQGQLGDGTTSDRNVPTLIGAGYSDISAGDHFSLALKNDGSLMAWGWNSFGKLGDGTMLNRSTPTLVDTGYSAISAGSSHSLALKNDGSLWAWGYNYYGQLGDGTTTNQSLPILIGTDHVAIAAGPYYSLALKSDGSLWSWGLNASGELGDGTTINRLVPTRIFSEGFVFFTHELQVASAGDGTGRITSDPQGIDCGTQCRATFDSGTEIILTPVADSGSVFTGWSGGCSGSQIPCSVNLNRTKYVIANFSPSDEDGDGLSDSIENAFCTDPLDADSDDDGILDGMEDINHNGVVDSDETSPCLSDSDADGIQDGTEQGYTLESISPDTNIDVFIPDADPTTTTVPIVQDSDSDGYTDGQEDLNFNGRIDFGEADPFDDSDVPLSGSIPTEKILPPDSGSYKQFGSFVAIKEDVAIIGAPNDNENGGASGAAYVLRWDGSNWVDEQKLMPSDGSECEYFGHAVAVSGTVALVGAMQDDDNGWASGSAYVFRWNGASWVEEQKLLASDGDDSEFFGCSVAISADTALVGAYQNQDTGSVYVFRWDGNSWVEKQKILPSDGASYCRFGYSMAVSGDVAMIGAYQNHNNYQDSYGSVYVFRWNGSDWVEEQKLSPSDGANNDYFGYSVAVSGDVTLVGAYGDDDNGGESGAAYMFRWNGTSWEEEQKVSASDGATENYFGSSVAICKDMALIGAYGDNANGNECGSAYIFHWNGSRWEEEQKFLPFQGADNDRFGLSTAIDGYWAFVGSPNTDSIYSYSLVSLFSDQDGDGLFDYLEDDFCTDKFDADSDDDGLFDGAEDTNHNGMVDANETNPCNSDTDHDGMPDGWEVDNLLNPLMDDARTDKDMDGFNNIREYFAGTSANDINDKPYFESEIENFESGDFNKFPWITNGDALWEITAMKAQGVYSAKAASILDSQSTYLEINRYTEAGDMNFFYSVDSEENYDFLRFYIDGVFVDGWSGATPFNQVFFSVTQGMHHFKWEYVKDKSDHGGADTAWIDDISFPGFVDSDHDGMPDDWEIENGFDPLIEDNDDDVDNDLFTNHMECLMGTDPQNQNDYPNGEKGFDGDLDVDGLDVSKFAMGLSSGTLTGSELQKFSNNFGR